MAEHLPKHWDSPSDGIEVVFEMVCWIGALFLARQSTAVLQLLDEGWLLRERVVGNTHLRENGLQCCLIHLVVIVAELHIVRHGCMNQRVTVD